MGLVREFIWKGTYEIQPQLKGVFKTLMRTKEITSLRTITLLINDTPCSSELLVWLSYAKPEEKWIQEMTDKFQSAGLISRQDIDVDDILTVMGKRYCHSVIFQSEWDISDLYESLFTITNTRQRGIMSSIGAE